MTLRDSEMGRSNNFDALRASLAVLVIFSHSYPLLRGDNATEPLSRGTGGQMTFGEVAVDGFFLISGYLITMSWQRSRNFFDYLRRRVLRIVPGYLVAVLFSSLVAGPLLSGDAGRFWGEFDVRQFLAVAANMNGAYIPGPTAVNGSLWSIRYEFLCYLAVPVWWLLGMFRWPALVAAATLGCTGIYSAQLLRGFQMPGSRLSGLWCFPGFWPRLAACFLAGAAFHLMGGRVVRSGWLAILALAGLVAAGSYPPAQALPLLFPYLGGYLLFYLAYAGSGPLKDIARRGDFTYGLYLYAFPVQLLLIRWSGGRLHPVGLMILATIATLGLAVLSWHLVERPCLKLKRPARVEPAEKAVATTGA